LEDADVRARVEAGLAALTRAGTGSSTCARRALLLVEPPSIDAGEVTDKGYVNQRAVLTRRASLVETLYREPLDASVITLPDPRGKGRLEAACTNARNPTP
jgi:feruloyl-CoA synthase